MHIQLPALGEPGLAQPLSSMSNHGATGQACDNEGTRARSTTLVAVVATIVARDGHSATVEKALFEAVTATRQEPGCIEYALHRKTDVPNAFVMFERWHDDAALAAHSKAASFQALAKILEGRADLTVEKLTQIA